MTAWSWAFNRIFWNTVFTACPSLGVRQNTPIHNRWPGKSARRAALGNLTGHIAVPEEFVEAANSLDKLYIPTRGPNGLEQGAPTEFYTRREAEEAIGLGQGVLDF